MPSVTSLTSLSVSQSLLATVGSLVLLILSRAIYNLYFHPLADVPGPFLARASGIPSWVYSIRGDRHIWIWQLNQVYGARFRVTPNTVLFCHPTAWNEIHSHAANVQRSPFYSALQRSHKERNTLTTVDPVVHVQKRKRLNLSFNEKSLQAASVFTISHVKRWVELLSEDCSRAGQWSAAKDFSVLANSLVFDIMGDLCFGTSFNVKEPGENPLKKMPESIANYLKFWYPFTRAPFLEFVLWLRPRGFDALLEKITPPEVKDYYQFVHKSMTERAALQEELRRKPDQNRRLDMFHFLCEAKDPETGAPAYTQEELWAEANMLILAGTDTTSVSLSGIFFYLVHDELRLQKLTTEIRTTFASNEDISPGAKLQSCIYLQACIREGMRLTPPGPSEAPRQICAGGMSIMGQYYPAGTIVGSPPWALDRNELLQDPDVFRPERWISDTGSAGLVKLIAAKTSPFLKGPYACPGQNIALMELNVTVARALYALDVRKAPGTNLGAGSPGRQWGQRSERTFHVRDAYMSLIEGPMVQFRKRQ